MSFDDQRRELERLLAMGRPLITKPSKRHLVVAKQLHPTAWSAGAEEHIAWGKRYKVAESTQYFSGQYLLIRKLALIQADNLLRLLDRQAAGKRDLDLLDAQALSKALEKICWDFHMADTRRGTSIAAARAVFFLKSVNGIPSPEAKVTENGEITLTWTEDDRQAIIAIDRRGNMTLALSPFAAAPLPITFKSYRNDADAQLAAVTDWIYFGAAKPELVATVDALVA